MLEYCFLIATSSVISTHLHDFILELGQEPVDNLVLLDREGVEVDLFHALDFACLDETAQLGDRLPFLLVGFRTTTAGSSSSSATVTSSSVSTASIAEAATSTGSVSHVVELCRCGFVENVVQ